MRNLEIAAPPAAGVQSVVAFVVALPLVVLARVVWRDRLRDVSHRRAADAAAK